MGKRRPFIDKEKALSYQVVHRSQRDALIADENASKLVLKPIPTSLNLLKKGKGLSVPDVDYEYEERSDHESDEEGDEFWEDEEGESDEDGDVDEDEDGEVPAEEASTTHAIVEAKNASVSNLEGETAAEYGITFEDQTSYNYLQHLKRMGDDPSAVFIDAKAAGKTPKAGIRFIDDAASVAMSEAPRRKVAFDMPADVFSSLHQEEVGMLNRAALESVHEVEPSMREILYALEDEAYVEDDIDDFFDAINAEVLPDEFSALVSEQAEMERKEQEEREANEEEWYKEYRQFRKEKTSDDEFDEEDDEVGELDARSERSHRHRSDRSERLTNFSMTSSAMFRNQHLTLLDDRFDEVMREYDDTSDEDGSEEVGDLGPDASPILGSISQRRLDGIFDAFLDSTEVVGRKKLLLRKVEPLKQMDAVRNELRVDGVAVAAEVESAVAEMKGGEELDEELEEEYQKLTVKDDREKWDVETVLSTYSNIYNHPKMIESVRKSAPKFRFSKGIPVVVKEGESKRDIEPVAEESEPEDGVEYEEVRNLGQARSKNETSEEKRARKAAIKAERRGRRAEKKAVKTAFSQEQERQKRTVMNAVLQDKMVPI